MKNLMKAFGIALLLSGVFAVTNVSAQTTPAQTTPPAKTTTTPAKPMKPADKVIGTDAKGNKVYKGAKGDYYINDKGVHVMEPKDAKITPLPKTPATK